MPAQEQWRPVLGFPDYEVSDLGRVRSYRRLASGKVLKGSRNVDGYRSYSLFDASGQAHSYLGHQLVARAFLGERPSGLEVRHLDGDGMNNRLSNLRYGTRAENMLDAVRHGTHPSASRTHCKNGHPFDAQTDRQRLCRTCRREANRRYYIRRALRAANVPQGRAA